MNVTSYNITDVGYHYIGLRVLAGLPTTAKREEQTSAISRSVFKYVNDRALRLLLPEPSSSFDTVGEKICQELVHFKFAQSTRGEGYSLTDYGLRALSLLNKRKHIELRQLMVTVHLQTYDNLRKVVQKYLEVDTLLWPNVEANQLPKDDYIQRLLEPTFNGSAEIEAAAIKELANGKSPGRLEDVLRERVLQHVMPDLTIGVPLFRSLVDRLVSLRLLNTTRVSLLGCEFIKSYSPCLAKPSPCKWYQPLSIELSNGDIFSFYLSEPNMADEMAQQKLVDALNKAYTQLSSQAGYYDLPEVRDFVCELLRIPEAAFDEGMNYLLDLPSSPITVGLQYERISSKRKPLVRTRQPIEIYNLIRRI